MPRGFGQTTAAMAGMGGREAFSGGVSAPGYAVLEREIDVGGRFTLWSSRESHGPCHPSVGKATPCGPAIRPPVAERAVRAGSGATPRPEGLVRHSDECGFTPSSLPSRGRSRTRDPLREGHPSTGHRLPNGSRLFLLACERRVAGPGHPLQPRPRHRLSASATTQRPPSGFRRRSMETPDASDAPPP